ncbi:MAG: hypothetical protein ACR2F6_05815 [Mycobacteriales bacterium]
MSFIKIVLEDWVGRPSPRLVRLPRIGPYLAPYFRQRLQDSVVEHFGPQSADQRLFAR